MAERSLLAVDSFSSCILSESFVVLLTGRCSALHCLRTSRLRDSDNRSSGNTSSSSTSPQSADVDGSVDETRISATVSRVVSTSCTYVQVSDTESGCPYDNWIHVECWKPIEPPKTSSEHVVVDPSTNAAAGQLAAESEPRCRCRCTNGYRLLRPRPAYGPLTEFEFNVLLDCEPSFLCKSDIPQRQRCSAFNCFCPGIPSVLSSNIPSTVHIRSLRQTYVDFYTTVCIPHSDARPSTRCIFPDWVHVDCLLLANVFRTHRNWSDTCAAWECPCERGRRVVIVADVCRQQERRPRPPPRPVDLLDTESARRRVGRNDDLPSSEDFSSSSDSDEPLARVKATYDKAVYDRFMHHVRCWTKTRADKMIELYLSVAGNTVDTVDDDETGDDEVTGGQMLSDMILASDDEVRRTEDVQRVVSPGRRVDGPPAWNGRIAASVVDHGVTDSPPGERCSMSPTSQREPTESNIERWVTPMTETDNAAAAAAAVPSRTTDSEFLPTPTTSSVSSSSVTPDVDIYGRRDVDYSASPGNALMRRPLRAAMAALSISPTSQRLASPDGGRDVELISPVVRQAYRGSPQLQPKADRSPAAVKTRGALLGSAADVYQHRSNQALQQQQHPMMLQRSPGVDKHRRQPDSGVLNAVVSSTQQLLKTTSFGRQTVGGRGVPLLPDKRSTIVAVSTTSATWSSDSVVGDTSPGPRAVPYGRSDEAMTSTSAGSDVVVGLSTGSRFGPSHANVDVTVRSG